MARKKRQTGTNTRKKRCRLFVTFEGIDGCGKSTQMALAERFLKLQRFRVTCLREPGSTRVAEKIRNILLHERFEMTDITELLLYEAARAELMQREILPALKAGRIVLCDRFYDSTTAYQGYGRKLDMKTVSALHRVAVGAVKPDLTFVFDVDLRTAFARRGGRADRLESQSRAFFNRVRKGFLEIARKESRRVKVIDASGSADSIFADVRQYLIRKLNRR